MKVFIIGVTGRVGGLLADELVARGDEVSGLVRSPNRHEDLPGRGIAAKPGDLTQLSGRELSELVGPADAVVFTAGAGGTGDQATTAIDGDGVVKAIEAARLAGVSRFALVSVFPEAGRRRSPGEGFEHYIAVKKSAEVALTKSGLDWVVLRPATLRDEPAQGTVELGPAEEYGAITRADVARTLADLVHESGISRQILELTGGGTPVHDAVLANRRS
jgi:uncharacterized protein YbjT (DUF2867 family)